MPPDIDEFRLNFRVQRIESEFGTRPNFFPAQGIGYAVQGFSRSLVLVSHFAATGKIRKKPPYDESVTPFVGPSTAGSLDIVFLLEIIRNTVNEYEIEVTTQFVLDLLSYSVNSLVGRRQQPNSDEVRKIIENRSGDAEALQDAIEPSIKFTHSPISDSNIEINIYTGDRNITKFDQGTKNYIEYDEFDEHPIEKVVSVGSLNVNSKIGRVYMFDEGRTVPFKISKDASRDTIINLSRSLNDYAAGKRGGVLISFFQILNLEGKIKKIIIFKAVPHFD